MKLKVLITALFVAGFAASFAFAGRTPAAETTTGATSTSTSTTTSTTDKGKGKHDKPKCQKVELEGSDGTGSVTFTVKKASKPGAALKGKSATLTLANATVHADACVDAAGALTFRHLEASVKG